MYEGDATERAKKTPILQDTRLVCHCPQIWRHGVSIIASLSASTSDVINGTSAGLLQVEIQFCPMAFRIGIGIRIIARDSRLQICLVNSGLRNSLFGNDRDDVTHR